MDEILHCFFDENQMGESLGERINEGNHISEVTFIRAWGFD